MITRGNERRIRHLLLYHSWWSGWEGGNRRRWMIQKAFPLGIKPRFVKFHIILCFVLPGNAALSIIEGESSSPPSPHSSSGQDIASGPPQSPSTHSPVVTVPRPVAEVLKIVYQTKCALVRVSFTTLLCHRVFWDVYERTVKTVSVVSNFKLPLSLSSFTCCRFCFVLFCLGVGGRGRMLKLLILICCSSGFIVIVS